MDFLLKILYCGSGGVSTLLVAFFFLAGLLREQRVGDVGA